MRLISVNVGKPRPNPGQPAVLTGIDKQPVSGPVMVTAPGREETGAVGLAGDRVYDVPDHGGPDQAIYAYAGKISTSGPPSWARRCGAASSART